MFSQRVSSALLAGALVAASSLTARAQDEKDPPHKAPPAPPPAAPAPAADPCAPAYRTICCTEWVPVQVTCERTVYKTEYRNEEYTACKWECFPVQKQRTCTYYESVPEKRLETRII